MEPAEPHLGPAEPPMQSVEPPFGVGGAARGPGRAAHEPKTQAHMNQNDKRRIMMKDSPRGEGNRREISAFPPGLTPTAARPRDASVGSPPSLAEWPVHQGSPGGGGAYHGVGGAAHAVPEHSWVGRSSLSRKRVNDKGCQCWSGGGARLRIRSAAL